MDMEGKLHSDIRYGRQRTPREKVDDLSVSVVGLKLQAVPSKFDNATVAVHDVADTLVPDFIFRRNLENMSF